MSPSVDKINGLSPAQVQTPEALPDSDLLASLGRLVRGLSLLFWGLPVALVTCWQTAQGDWFRVLGIVPPLVVTALLLYALQFLGHFQKQERVWHSALEHARLLALLNFGLSPFLYWFNQVSHPFFAAMAHLMFMSGLAFLYSLNPALWRLVAMLPDETLRMETKLFTSINRYLLIVAIVLSAAYFTLIWLYPYVRLSFPVPAPVATALVWVTLFLFLLPVAMTMALIWKIKEAIFASIFGANQGG